jgi:GT2 family glycosyltransferase
MNDRDSLLLSIVIVNWNTRDLLRQCLESIYAGVAPISLEVIVVDNASMDGSADMVAEGFPGVNLIRSPGNLGFSAGNNLALKTVGGRYVMLLNPDAELLPDAVGVMVGFAEEHPEAGVVGPMLLNSDGSLQKNGRKFPGLLREILGLTRLYRLIWGYYDRKMGWGREDFNITAKVDEVSGACMLVRKAAIDQTGGLDERFFMYYEEVDWCLRMKKAGWETYYLPDAHVKHHWAQGAKQTGLQGSRIFHDSQYRYFLKHHGLAQALVLRCLSLLLLFALSVRKSASGVANRIRNGGRQVR